MWIEQVQGHPVRLRAPHDLSFLDTFGRVFMVLDQMTSGALGFGVESEQGRLYIKYAGAQTINCPYDPRIAVERLRMADPWYQDARHPALIQHVFSLDYGSGFLSAFRYEDAVPLAPIDANYQSLRRADLVSRLKMMDDLLDLHAALERKSLIVAGLKDSHLLYDAGRQRLILCNIDHYLPLPAINTRGRLPGSPMYLAPEAYQEGVALDESLSVYAMGALAFALFGDRIRQHKGPWEGPDALRLIAAKAVSSERAKRYPNVESLQKAWRETVLKSPLLP